MKRRLSLVAALSVAALLLVTGVVMATLITVDGNPTDWPGNPDCTIGAVGCSAVITDALDVTYAGDPVEPEYDLNHLWITNDPTYLYLRIDTYPAITSTWLQQGVSVPTMNFCFDTDSNPATGSVAPISNCNLGSTMPGVDRVITFVDDGSGNPSAFRFRDCTGAWPCTVNGTKLSHVTVAYQNQGASTESATEFRVPLADMGFTGAHVYTTTVAVYYDNGASPTEDSVPDAPPYPTVLISCDQTVGPCSPTAITLNSLEAKTDTQNNTTAVLILAGAVLTLGVAVVAIRRRRTA